MSTEQSTSRNGSRSMPERLDFLYPGKGDEVYGRVRALMEDFASRQNTMQGTADSGQRTARRDFFSQEDAVLICYGDHVRQPGVATLQTLNRFLDGYVRGLLSTAHILPFSPYSS